MKYYRIRKEHGGKPAYAIRNGELHVVGQYIANELFTEKELKRLGLKGYEKYVDIVYLPKYKTFMSFGARFEINYKNIEK